MRAVRMCVRVRVCACVCDQEAALREVAAASQQLAQRDARLVRRDGLQTSSVVIAGRVLSSCFLRVFFPFVVTQEVLSSDVSRLIAEKLVLAEHVVSVARCPDVCSSFLAVSASPCPDPRPCYTGNASSGTSDTDG
jgi:hypothetical protein